MTQSLATLVPISPGGIGTEQAFIVFVFEGAVPRRLLLAFCVGMADADRVNVIVRIVRSVDASRTLVPRALGHVRIGATGRDRTEAVDRPGPAASRQA